MFKQRHHFRLDDATEAALAEICRHTFSTKSTLMRRYVQEGVAREAEQFARQADRVIAATKGLKRV